MKRNLSTIIFVSVICGLFALFSATVHIFGLYGQVDATIRFFFFDHKYETLAGSFIFLGIVLVICSSESIIGTIRRANNRNSTRLV
jgi:hypothetical protein